MTKGAPTRGRSTTQEYYFQLSATSAEQARLRDQLDLLRSKESLILQRLEVLARQISRLRSEVDHHEKAAITMRGKQLNTASYGSPAWDEIELRY